MFTLKEILTYFAILMIASHTITFMCIWSFFISPLRKKIEEQNRILYTLMNKCNIYGDKLFDTSMICNKSNEDLMTLSKRFELLESDIHMSKNNIMPLPQLAEMIESTIREQVAIEIALSGKMKLPRKDMVNKITNNVSATYPYVSIEYIAKKCLAVIETMTTSEERE